MKKSILCLIMAASIGSTPVAAWAYKPMSEAALKATTGQAAETSIDKSADELLQAYYALFGETPRDLPEGASSDEESLTAGGELGDLGFLNWAFRALSTRDTTRTSLLATIQQFNASGTEVVRQLPSVIMELPHLVIIAPRSSHTIVVSTTDGKEDDKNFGTVSKEASLMAIQSGMVEIAAH
ncbi:hypothetical protein [Desulfoluna sp.]|uniref:hypothetical protein n=1 Tax=Desulfoluna sp. TaxID=2045199 RepID=UPI00262A4723|nr:hypothetical protein [Desulfoluna sp.]